MNHTKTMTSDLSIKRLVWSVVLTIGLAAALMPRANAHDTVYPSVARYDYYGVSSPRHGPPRWLRKDMAFKRWYLSSAYQNARYVSWTRLYDLYLLDRHYQRKMRKAKRRHYHFGHADNHREIRYDNGRNRRPDDGHRRRHMSD